MSKVCVYCLTQIKMQGHGLVVTCQTETMTKYIWPYILGNFKKDNIRYYKKLESWSSRMDLFFGLNPGYPPLLFYLKYIPFLLLFINLYYYLVMGWWRRRKLKALGPLCLNWSKCFATLSLLSGPPSPICFRILIYFIRCCFSIVLKCHLI